MEKNIRKEKLIHATAIEVWQALTDPVAISAWLMPVAQFTPVVGSKFVLQAKPMGKWDGKIYGEILVADTPLKLSYTWKGDQMNSTTIITWTLIPSDGNTMLIVEHTGFKGFADVVLGIFHAMGWGRFLKQLDQYINR